MLNLLVFETKMTFDLIKHLFFRVIDARTWPSKRSSAMIDSAINSVLEKGTLIYANEYILRFNVNNDLIDIWVENYPYASARISSINNKKFLFTECAYIQTRYKVEKLRRKCEKENNIDRFNHELNKLNRIYENN